MIVGFTLGLGLTKIIPYLVYGAVIVIALVAPFKPRFALFCTVPLLPFRVILFRLYAFPMGKDAWDILLMLLVIGTVLNLGRLETIADENRAPLARLVRFKIVFLFASLFIGAAIFGLGNPLSLGDRRFLELKNYILLPILLLITHRLVRNKRDVYTLIVIMVAVLFVADCKYAYDNRYQVFDSFSWRYKEAGIFAMLGGNVLAAFKAHFIFLPLALAFYEKRILLRLFYLGTAAFTLYPILFLFSRGAYAALYLGILYLGLTKSRTLLVVAILIPIFWTTMLPHAVVERIEMTETDAGELDSSTDQRFELWGLCVRNFVKSPLFGVGFYTFYLVHSREDPHNIYFEVLGEQGLIGIFILLALFGLTFANGRWLERNATDPMLKGLGLAAPVVVISCATTNLFGDRWSYLEIGAFFFVMMALVSKTRLIVASERAHLETGGADPAPATPAPG